MRRTLAAVALCGLLILAGCAEAGLAPGDVPDGSEVSDGDDEGDGGERSDGGPAGPTEGTLEVHAVNLGQADATLVLTGEETMLVDTGDWRDDGETVIDYLEAHDVDRIDHLVATHAHSDHVGGHAAIIEHYETERDGVGAVYDSGVPHTSRTYEDYLDAVDRNDVPLYEVADGDEIPFAGARASVLNPEEPGGDDLHYNSVSLRLQFGEVSFLFTGDAERDAERRMVDAHGDRLSADVYHAGHHGSRTSSGSAFLEAVDPEVAVVSSAYDSQYGHPHEELLDRLAERDVRTTWTAVHGTTVFVSEGEAVSVRTQHDATTDPSELLDEEEATADPTDPARKRFVAADGGAAQRVSALVPSATAPSGTTGVLAA